MSETQIVECVPNFSEGRDRAVIDAISAEILATAGATLLDVDPGADTNRTVVTFVGDIEAVGEAAFRAIRRAAALIDMRKHRGAHPRIGATDVCPFVPVSGVSMEDCVRLAQRVGRRVGEELGIPVYLYEAAASRPERRNLAEVRKGEYEGLAAKLRDPAWAPDYGPGEPWAESARSGASIIGARQFLIAYNVNLNTRDRRLANEIALTIRESGRPKKDEAGKPVLDERGEKVMLPGLLPACKATGWVIEEYGLAQVSINLTDYQLTPPHLAFEECRRQAERLGVLVTGSELVGLIPAEAMRMAGRYFLEKQGKSAGVPEEDLLDVAVRSLGLAQLSPFDPQKKVIEYRVRKGGGLCSRGVRDLVNEVSRDSPAPGGGSVAALAGALGAALAGMVANLTVGKKDYRQVDGEMRRLAAAAQALKDRLLRAVDLDTEAFAQVMAAMRLPRKTEEERGTRSAALEAATQAATKVPLEVCRACVEVLGLARAAAARGFSGSLSDAGVAAAMARAALDGAFYNVRINLKALSERGFVERVEAEAQELRRQGTGLADEIAAKVLGELCAA